MPYFVAPMPVMQRQPDLNCGYYCERALLDHWFTVVNGHAYQHLHLNKTTLYGFNPHTSNNAAVANANIVPGNKPPSVAGWEQLLRLYGGPVIISGKLGGADWGTWKLQVPFGGPTLTKWKAGCGHYMLIVGTDIAADRLYYKDPLQGDALRHGDFVHMNKRIDATIYYITSAVDAQAIFAALGSN